LFASPGEHTGRPAVFYIRGLRSATNIAMSPRDTSPCSQVPRLHLRKVLYCTRYTIVCTQHIRHPRKERRRRHLNFHSRFLIAYRKKSYSELALFIGSEVKLRVSVSRTCSWSITPVSYTKSMTSFIYGIYLRFRSWPGPKIFHMTKVSCSCFSSAWRETPTTLHVTVTSTEETNKTLVNYAVQAL
jgi:hypothetical protein